MVLLLAPQSQTVFTEESQSHESTNFASVPECSFRVILDVFTRPLRPTAALFMKAAGCNEQESMSTMSPGNEPDIETRC